MFRGSSKPYSAVTVQVDRLTSEQYEEDDVAGIYDLVEVIRIQSSGPTEAARALRKKLKYGNPHRQLRALVLLDGLLENAGSRFQRTFVDEPLLERLRLLPRDDTTDPQVRKKCQVLFVQWANAYKNTPGLDRIANLYKELPKTQRPAQARQKVLQDTENYDSDGEPPSSSGNRSRAGSSATPASRTGTPVTLTSTTHGSSGFSKLSKRSKSSQGKPFNLSKEKENMTTAIAQASIASTNLLNGLQLINRETQRVSENPEVIRRFEACKNLRRKILYYIQNVESDTWIGSLVNANDELVKALTAYEITDRSIDDDSDSDAWEHSGAHTPNPPPQHNVESNTQQLAGLKMEAQAPPAKPPRPAEIAMPPRPSFPGAQGGVQDAAGDASTKSSDIVVNEREVEKEESDAESDNGLHRVHSNQASSPEVEQDENVRPRGSVIYTGADQDKSQQSRYKGKGRSVHSNQTPSPALQRDEQEEMAWLLGLSPSIQAAQMTPELREKMKKAKKAKKAEQKQRKQPSRHDHLESDLSLERTPASKQLPQPPSEEAQQAIKRERIIREDYNGHEPRAYRREQLRPVYAENKTNFEDRECGESNPTLATRIKQGLAKLLCQRVGAEERQGQIDSHPLAVAADAGSHEINSEGLPSARHSPDKLVRFPDTYKGYEMQGRPLEQSRAFDRFAPPRQDSPKSRSSEGKRRR